MKPCIACGEENVSPEDPARYDVMNPEFTPETSGPYCEACWKGTYTFQVTPMPEEAENV